MTLNDLECPIHLKVRFTDRTLDVRTLWLSDSTIRIGVARGGRGEWAGGPSPLPCAQLTRCFSAVAELLVALTSKPAILFLSLGFTKHTMINAVKRPQNIV